MKTMGFTGLAVLLSLVSMRAEAQSFLFVDASRPSFGLGGGTSFGGGRVQPGISFSARSGYALNEAVPDVDAYAMVVVRLAPTWFLLNNVGAGTTVGHDTTWSARALVILTGTAPVSLRVSLFAAWTPRNDGWFLSASAGPTIRLWDTGMRIFPNLALSILTPGTGRLADVSVSPGCTLFFHF